MGVDVTGTEEAALGRVRVDPAENEQVGGVAVVEHTRLTLCSHLARVRC